MKELGLVGWVALFFVVLGGVDSGFYGMFSFHVLEVLTGAKVIGRLLFIFIGFSAAYLIYFLIEQKKQL